MYRIIFELRGKQETILATGQFGKSIDAATAYASQMMDMIQKETGETITEVHIEEC